MRSSVSGKQNSKNWKGAGRQILPANRPARCQAVPPAFLGKVEVVTRSDFWLAYAEVFPRRTHRSTGKGAGETCHVERWNRTLRQRLGRFVRKTLSFSKCERMHELALRLFIHEYNQQPITY